jgi:uncharacterized cupredoxin-like copper-binding protein
MTRITALLPFALAGLLAACGSSSSTPTKAATSATSAVATASSAASTPPAGGSQLSLSETEFKIAPATPAVAKTGKITITVKNNGKIVHALTVNTPSGPVSTSKIQPGGTATLTVDVSKPGRYTFYCPIDGHRMLGMVGALVVGGGGSGAASGGAATSSSPSSSNPY